MLTLGARQGHANHCLPQRQRSDLNDSGAAGGKIDAAVVRVAWLIVPSNCRVSGSRGTRVGFVSFLEGALAFRQSQ